VPREIFNATHEIFLIDSKHRLCRSSLKIVDHESEELDLDDPKTYRDLSSPMGAQNEESAQAFRDRYEAACSTMMEFLPFTTERTTHAQRTFSTTL
jgi:hypothetical protein